MPVPLRVDIALLSNEPVVSAKNTLFIGDGGGPGKGSFFFIAHDRLKIGVGEGGDELLVWVAGVLVATSDALCPGLGKGGGVAARPGLDAVGAEIPRVDDVCVILPDEVISDARLHCAWLLRGVW